MPEMGRPYYGNTKLRELPIKFGSSNYLALYRFDKQEDTIYVLAFKHQREQKYF